MRPAERRWFDEAVARRAASSGASAAVIARRLEARLAAGEPLQYVLGTWSFRGHELRVDHRALIPRYETEQLVEHVLAAVRTGMRVLDVGTGSGAIAISLALEGPRLEVTGSDVDPRALALARENVRATGALVTLVRRSWFEGAEPESLDVVVANPLRRSVRVGASRPCGASVRTSGGTRTGPVGSRGSDGSHRWCAGRLAAGRVALHGDR